MPDALIIGYGASFDAAGRVLLLHRRPDHPPWAGQWWLPGGITPLSEEPDATVPRLFADLLRQQVSAAYIDTVFGQEPLSGRHTVHNGYRVHVEHTLGAQPPDETNPFDSAQWFSADQALAELPAEQASLLRSAIEREAGGEARTAEQQHVDLDALFEALEGAAAAPSDPLSARDRALLVYAVETALGRPAADSRAAALVHGLSSTQLDAAAALAEGFVECAGQD